MFHKELICIKKTFAKEQVVKSINIIKFFYYG